MDIRTAISKPVLAELEDFNRVFAHSLASDSPKMQAVAEYVMQTNGKRIRPIVLLLAAKLAGNVSPVSVDSAVLIELLHTASLLHDDVVDETKERRGKASVNAVFDNKVAILAGDYILSVSLYKAILIGDLAILKVFGKLGQYLSLGELNQQTNVQEISLSEDNYLKVIREKTAMLFSACTEIGALSAKASEQVVSSLREYGENIGMCFQIRDDIFDYYDSKEIGKPTGNDIREGKITLPLLHAIEKADEPTRTQVLDILTNQDFTDTTIPYLLDFAKANKGIEYAYTKMEYYAQRAKANLEVFADSPSKQSLLQLVDYVMVRTK